MSERQFPLLGNNSNLGSIPWWIAEQAYMVYANKYGDDQSLERLAERGGFGPEELDKYYPEWREKCSLVATLQAQLTAANALIKVLDIKCCENCRLGNAYCDNCINNKVRERADQLTTANERIKVLEEAIPISKHTVDGILHVLNATFKQFYRKNHMGSKHCGCTLCTTCKNIKLYTQEIAQAMKGK